MDENQENTANISPVKRDGERPIAVAIKGGTDKSPDSTPQVIASGYGKLAEQIMQMAFDKGIKVRADADLAQLLAALDLDTPIPSEAVIAVAEILAKVYEANTRLSVQGTP
ncbi:MAG: EscU/YscU/HrcU family type III secretion system export apparatus switch protein [Alphaproteobacteria bacterium]|nr:EscU/YscU/HrcU family type III secretion system export apparatus switch protein [Alphaproteobacteria bacterium]